MRWPTCCSGRSDAEPTTAAAETEPAQGTEETDPAENGGDATMDEMPGEGVTVRIGRATWDTGWFQAEIFASLLSELGYETEAIDPLDNPIFYQSAAQGDIDMWANGWFPLHNTYLEDAAVADNVELVGYEVKAGAIQGYLIDKKTADEHGITNLGDLQDPEIAALFDGDGNGLADLFGCDPGWGCELVINHQIEAYELTDTVEHIQGSYNAIMGDVVARFQRGEPVLFYTWTPNWTVGMMIPGQDVVWLEVPFPSLPEDQMANADATIVEGVEGCAGDADPCEMGWEPNDIRVVANKAFLDANPSAHALFEQVEIPLVDILVQNAKMFEGEDNDEDIQRHAEEWIEENRDQVDMWLDAARGASS
ncbi:MAG: glycine betaine/L-proline ABC transporter substrate-binding protein ProX [Chloroflexaceae bacterium]|nr:glycine betaine/L-proline ABC transporter substrate-binding protein ProX [Chloroflexaceae bacterium]